MQQNWKKCGERGHIDLYLLLIELITTQHHVLHCKKNLPIRPKTQKIFNVIWIRFELHALVAQPHSSPFGDLCNNNLIYKCTHERMATNWNECYKSKTMTKLVENYKCNKQSTMKGEEVQPYHNCKPNLALDDNPYVFIMKDMHVNNKKNIEKMVTYIFFYLKITLQTFHHCWMLVIWWGFFSSFLFIPFTWWFSSLSVNFLTKLIRIEFLVWNDNVFFFPFQHFILLGVFF